MSKLKFTILLPDGTAVNHTTKFQRNGEKYTIETPEQLCRLMKGIWRKETNSKSFEDWATELNNDTNFEGGFTADDALDNLSSLMHLNINGQHVSIYDYMKQHNTQTK